MKLEELLSPELYEQVKNRIDEVNKGQTDKTKCVRFADLSEGGYISTDKYNSQVNALTQQVNDLRGQITQRDSDMKKLNEQLTAAQSDAGKLTDAQKALSDLQTKYSEDQKAWEAKNQRQAYEFMIREKANGHKFSSNAARRDFISQAISKDLKVDGENLIGYGDFLKVYMEENPGAIVVEENKDDAPAPNSGNKPPQIVLPNAQQQGAAGQSPFNFNFNGVRAKPTE
jgi:outer membrane murein-binding lipoprotein Lpp